jgi:hypothetical protein
MTHYDSIEKENFIEGEASFLRVWASEEFLEIPENELDKHIEEHYNSHCRKELVANS